LFKKLDILIIRSFIGPFIVTFFISLFVLIMQFFWLYMDEMIGKGISIWMLLKLLIYMSTTLVPLALPLSILLSSIMTFGNMGENFELVAIKSSGISFFRFMAPLLVFIIFVGYMAFLFSDNVIPIANLKALSLLYDVRSAKPTLNIRPDQFNNDIPGYAIRVASKDKDGNTIHDVIIYDHTDMNGNNKVIIAKEGQMLSTQGKQSLTFKLRDGWRYEEGYDHGVHNFNQTRVHFEKYDKLFDLSSFTFKSTNVDLFKNAYQMMNVAQLSENIDSMKHSKARVFTSIGTYLMPYISLENRGKERDSIMNKLKSGSYMARTYDSSFLKAIPDSMRAATLGGVIGNMRNMKSLLDVTSLTKKLDNENFLKYVVEWHRKFTLSFACILLLLIGAPLGAIIRKGGLGMPLVIAVIFFMAFHILNITGEKLAKANSVSPWLGMWMSTLILLPVAIWLIIAARNDSQVFSKERYSRLWRRIKSIFPVKNATIV
jgi:lipopolysaccharide export system permease protein